MIWYGLKFLPRSDPVEEWEANAFQVVNMENSMTIGQLTISTNGPFFLIAGPCVIEEEATMLQVADFLRETSEKLGIPTIFKSSYDKANRTSMDSFRGPGVEEGLEILQKVKERRGRWC
jgi:2-dehydro-3-deoxyphosphooctonate aldolase (KDO 8-P synthase)